MKSFLQHIKEEVLPTVQVADGGLDIEKPAVRAAINAAIAGVVSQPAVTPYVVFNRLSKLLAQYHIVLPKKFLEGDKGVEVFEIRQFGHRMGMTDSGEFVNHVPTTHYLFLQYGIITPMGVTYAKPLVGCMFRVTARLVDKVELDRLLDMAEITMSEEAECMQAIAKANAPKEPMHDITSDEKKKGNKEAVADSEKGLKEGRMPASVIKHKQRIANMTPEEKAKKFAGKSKEELEAMARRHGYGKGSNEYSKHVKEEQIDEISQKTLSSYTAKAYKDYSDRLKGWTKKGPENMAKADKRWKGLTAAAKRGPKTHQVPPGKEPVDKSGRPYWGEDVEQVDESTPAWQRKEGKNPSGGLNAKGVASYRREHPGSKLKTAVTTKPSKLKKGSKAANRRKSFCARMSGMKKRLTSAKTARDPDSRINKSLRKWNC